MFIEMCIIELKRMTRIDYCLIIALWFLVVLAGPHLGWTLTGLLPIVCKIALCVWLRACADRSQVCWWYVVCGVEVVVLGVWTSICTIWGKKLGGTCQSSAWSLSLSLSGTRDNCLQQTVRSVAAGGLMVQEKSNIIDNLLTLSHQGHKPLIIDSCRVSWYLRAF